MSLPDKVHIIVRRDLSPEQQAVQAVHAAVQLMSWDRDDSAVREWSTAHHTVVILGAANHEELCEVWNKLNDGEYIPRPFFEEDRGGEMTAVACHPLTPLWFFKGLELL